MRRFFISAAALKPEAKIQNKKMYAFTASKLTKPHDVCQKLYPMTPCAKFIFNLTLVTTVFGAQTASAGISGPHKFKGRLLEERPQVAISACPGSSEWEYNMPLTVSGRRFESAAGDSPRATVIWNRRSGDVFFRELNGNQTVYIGKTPPTTLMVCSAIDVELSPQVTVSLGIDDSLPYLAIQNGSLEIARTQIERLAVSAPKFSFEVENKKTICRQDHHWVDCSGL
jgi:hypothetical protein